MKRILRGIPVLIFICILSALLTGEKSPIREDEADFLTGEGAYGLEFAEGSAPYVQTFRAQYKNLHQIGFVVDGIARKNSEGKDTKYFEATEGSVLFELLDADDSVLMEKDIPIEDLKCGVYTDVEIDRQMEFFHTYKIRLTSRLAAEIQPTVEVCSKSYRLAENKTLSREEKIAKTQMLTKYNYLNALRLSHFLQIVALLLLAGAGLVFGLPKNPKIRHAVAALLLLLGPYILGCRLERMMPTVTLYENALKWNMLLMYLFEIIVLLMTQSTRFTVIFCNVLLTILYIANYFVFAFRGTFLKVNEISAIGTALEVAGSYRIKLTPAMVDALCIMGVFVCYGLFVAVEREERQKWKTEEGIRFGYIAKRLLIHAATFLAGVVLILIAKYVFIETDFLLDHGFIYIAGIEQEEAYQHDGFLVGSLINIKFNRIREPEGYSAESVERILEPYAAGGAGAGNSGGADRQDLPHVILVMNESFSDLRVNGALEMSRENLSFFNSLQENTMRGTLNASVIGGGTANTEFEMFTGCAMGLLPDSYYPYEQAIYGPKDTMISNMKNAGYTTYSVHPRRATNWRRNIVYPYFGFDRIIFEEAFQDAEIIHNGVSDRETYEKIEELFENREKDERMFIFALTIQNHGYYDQTNVDMTVRATNVESEEADIYLSLIYESDRQFEKLIRYFEAQDEKVMVCMFGDHQPMFEDRQFYEELYRQSGPISEVDKRMNLYKTPFVIWTNYDTEEVQGIDIGMNYLGVLVQQAAGVELTPFGNFLADQMKKYPIITVNGYVDSEGNFGSWSGENNEFPDYRMIQYNYLFDKKNKVTWGYTRGPGIGAK